MLSASHRLGYKDKETGRVEKLPLSTLDYDPEVTATEMYLDGYEIFEWRYSISRSNWGKMKPWTPTDAKLIKKKNPQIEDENGYERGIRDLSKEERKTLLKMLRNKKTANEIIDTLKMNYKKVLEIGQRFRRGELKK